MERHVAASEDREALSGLSGLSTEWQFWELCTRVRWTKPDFGSAGRLPDQRASDLTLSPEEVASQIPCSCARNVSPPDSLRHMRFSASTGTEPSWSSSSQRAFDSYVTFLLTKYSICSFSARFHIHLEVLPGVWSFLFYRLAGWGAERAWFSGDTQGG